MSITASNSAKQRELIPAGNYIARCFQMIHIGTIQEAYKGETKLLNKVRIGWELPTETRVFKEENGEQPMVISQDYTVSLNKKSNLRKLLTSWRGKDFTEAEAKSFDITKLIGAACMLNIIHKPGNEDPTKTFQSISSVSAMPKGVPAPAAVNKPQVLSYDDWNDDVFRILPDFLQNKIMTSVEYAAMIEPATTHIKQEPVGVEDESDLPF